MKSVHGQLSWHTNVCIALCFLASRELRNNSPDTSFLYLIAVCLFVRILAGNLAAFQKITGSSFADMADLIELLFGYYIGSLIPVNPLIHYRNTAGLLFRL